MAQLSVAAELARFGPDVSTSRPVSRAQAAEYCRRLACDQYENFTVVSWLLPRALRPHFYAVYAYCRWADDLADEAAPADRLDLLDWWQDELDACYAGSPRHPVFVALADTIEQFAIPRAPFAALLVAFRQDQHVLRYATHEQVLDYCRNSANPVGRLVLYLGRCHDDEHGRLADQICTGLQLINFCQDVARDWDNGRLYLPQATLDAAGYTPAMLAAREFNPQFRQAMQVEVARAEEYLRSGEPLAALVPGALRMDVQLFAAGGLAMARAIRRADFDVWRARPTLSKRSKLGLLARCWWQSKFGKTRAPSRTTHEGTTRGWKEPTR